MQFPAMALQKDLANLATADLFLKLMMWME